MKKQTGQALLELSVFGALFLVFLGVLISYGLQYNYQQHVMQRTFRKALYYSNLKQQKNRGSITYMRVDYRHTPDPLDKFAVGSVGAYVSSASVTRDYEMYKSANDETSLPAIAFDISGMDVCPGSQLSPQGSKPPCFYLTAGFAIDPTGSGSGDRIINLNSANPNDCDTRMIRLKKYEFIFGQLNITKYKEGGAHWNPAKDDIDEWNGDIRVIDTCEGEILQLGACRKQCNLITIPEVCKRACGNEGRFDCGFCDAVINEPWYCAQLGQLFKDTQNLAMGLQQNTFTVTRERNAFAKSENKNRIATTDTFNWSKVIERMFVFRPYGDISGNAEGQIMSSSTGQAETQTWRTKW